MIKTFAQMNTDERRLRQVADWVRLPMSQTQIIRRYLNAAEIKIIEKGAARDLETVRRRAVEGGQPFDEKRTDFDWLIANGHNNILRIAELQGKLPTEAYLYFALELGLLHGEAEHRWLTKIFVGEDVVIPCVSVSFVDNKLFVNGKEVMTVRSTKLSKLDHILRSFEETNWKKRKIDFRKTFLRTNASGKPKDYIEKAVKDKAYKLNEKQSAIKFVADCTSISWSLNQAG